MKKAKQITEYKGTGNWKYKGIALFGAPGSGKTTIAKWILEAFPHTSKIEAFDAIINPAAQIDKLPKSEKQFSQLMADLFRQNKNYGKKISRDEAREFFLYLKKKYSASVIARSLIHIQTQIQKLAKLQSAANVIFAGIRGSDNAMHFKKNGYLVIYLKTPDADLSNRVAKRESFSLKDAETERHIEERIFSTNAIEQIAHLTFNTAIQSKKEMLSQIKALTEERECKRCINTSNNLSNAIGESGYCEVCERYMENFDPKLLKDELEFLKTFVGKRVDKKGATVKAGTTSRYDCLVGISGGKDSTATLYQIKKMGFTPLAFTLDTGYYPKHIFPRSKQVAKELGIDHKRIDIKKYARASDIASFKKTADLYDEKETEALKEKFRTWYTEDRRHYSIKCNHAIPFVRTCQLCRRLVVRAYYDLAIAHNVQIVVLGVNEWAGLSQDSSQKGNQGGGKNNDKNGKSKKFVFSAIRKLQPYANKPPVYIVHLPFLLQRRLKDTQKVLRELGWKVPTGEFIVESNANSCLFARAAESKAKRLLGFHPDATRLAREVTVGFITKEQARKALAKNHAYPSSVRAVLKKADII